jgi:general secretion pathway protein G
VPRLPSSLLAALAAACIAAAAWLAPPLAGNRDERLTRAQADLDTLRSAIKLKIANDGAPPTDAQGLEVLAYGPSQELENIPPDPWGHAYAYRRIDAAPGYTVYSLGPDGIDQRGGGDDVTSRGPSARCADEAGGCGLDRMQAALGALLLLGLACLGVIGARLLRAWRSARRPHG